MDASGQNIVATRQLTLEEPSGVRAVTVCIYEPRPVESDWVAEFEIVGLSNENDKYHHRGMQVDSVGALLQAFEMAAAKLMGSDAYRDKRLYWLEPGDHCGFAPRDIA